MGTWQSREQQVVRALESIASNFEKAVALQTARQTSLVGEIEAATKEHRNNAQKAQWLLLSISWRQIFWPCFGCGVAGSLLTVAVVYFR